MTDTTPADRAAPGMSTAPAIRWAPLIALATAQFVMVLDQSVMNVSISTLVAEFDTTVTTIQAVITLYCLVMAMFMLIGAKIGDIIGRRRAFLVALIIYGIGSLMTALGADSGSADRGLVDLRRDQCGAGSAGARGAHRGELRGSLSEGGLHRAPPRAPPRTLGIPRRRRVMATLG